MPRFGKIIVSMTSDGVIGLDGALPWHYSADLKRFKRLTLNSTVIMGRKTWDSLPIRPLPKRQNIVLTQNSKPEIDHYSSLELAVENAAHSEIWFIGGSEIFALSVNYSKLIDVTYVPDQINGENCVFFPPIDWNGWEPGPKIRSREDERLVHQEFYFRTQTLHS